jgi:alkyldihydroxyacetonephosphate synthase
MSERRRSFYGWGYEGAVLPPGEMAWFEGAWSRLLGVDAFEVTPMPREEELTLPAPRLAPPASLAGVCTSEKWERLLHSYGRSTMDIARMVHGRDFSNPPDVVAYPRTDGDVASVLDWAGEVGAAVIPFGGGSSVVGGVNPPSDPRFSGVVTLDDPRFSGVVTLDLKHLDRVLEIDDVSGAARVQAGVLGPALERQLKPSGLTLRFFLQAWEFSSLGGWIATRAAGHFATAWTQIDDHVESLRVVTPAGSLESRRLPSSGAGPSPDRLFIGSEGALGVITEAWMRLHRRPRFRATTSVLFDTLEQGCEAVRALSQSGLYPANARLIEAEEAAFTEAGDGSAHVLVLGFESADHPLDAWMSRALELCADHHGRWDEAAPARAGAQREGAAGNWRERFLRGPYYREHAIARGVMRDTVETAIPWSGFMDLYQQVTDATRRTIREVTGREGSVTVRFTHLYPDGPAPYFTWHAFGDKARLAEQFRAIKAGASDAMLGAGGTITHHHALGRDHRAWYDRQRPALFARALGAAKGELDPRGILNPGVLV